MDELKKLIKKDQDYEQYPDLDKLIEVARLNDYELNKPDAKWVWEKHSESFSAGWLIISGYSNSELWNIINIYMIGEEGQESHGQNK